MRSSPIFTIAALALCLASAPAWAQQALHCSPCYHSFGKVETGASKSYSVQISNTGSSTLTILSTKIQGTAFSFGKVPTKINPGTTVTLAIAFAPKTTGHTLGAITLVTATSALIIGSQGTGIDASTPELSISPTTLNFGNVNVGSTASLKANLTASNTAVTISTDRSTSSEFAIQGVKLPLTIAAGTSIPVTIQFAPNASGTAVAKAGFVSNAVNTPTVAQVEGTGVAKSTHSVDLSWDKGSATAVGYNVYRGPAKAGPFSKLNSALNSSTDYTDSSVVSGSTYFYATTEVNAQGQESAYSNLAEAVIPSP